MNSAVQLEFGFVASCHKQGRRLDVDVALVVGEGMPAAGVCDEHGRTAVPQLDIRGSAEKFLKQLQDSV